MSAQDSAINFVISEFCEAMSVVFEQTTGAPYVFRSSEAAEVEASKVSLSFIFTFSGSVTGRMKVELDTDSAAMLATKFIGMEDSVVEYLPEHDDAVMEILGQTGGVIAGLLRTRFGTAEVATERRDDSSVDSAVAFVVAPRDGSGSTRLKLFLENTLAESASRVLAESLEQGSGSHSDIFKARQVASPEPSAQDQLEQQKLQLIMDVELSLTLRFGQRVLALSEVADLTSGSVIELDRQVDEPVELLLGDRVIARGEVVIVDGNYGLRVTEMASVADRASLLSA